MLDEPEVLVPAQVRDVGRVPLDEIIDRDNAMTFRQQPVRQVRSLKPRPARDD